jgi:NAD(P)-dependent dehydrogenase (short-subunit alcohol dehydrogenase family)
MNLSLDGKVALIVGGTSGIGLAAAEHFVAAGANVVISGRDLTKGMAAQSFLGSSATYVGSDIAQPTSVEALFRNVVAQFGRIDCAVNAAAITPTSALLHETTDADAIALLNTDVFAQFLCMKHEIEVMLRVGAGTIVNVSSVNGLSGVPTAAMYSAGRHAVLGLTRSAAREYIAHNIRINAVCPGATNTPRRQQRLAHLAPDVQSELAAQTAQAIPIGRLATAHEIANAIVWLSSPSSSYVVGHCLVVDGGLSA